jgi:hypothetical protein
LSRRVNFNNRQIGIHYANCQFEIEEIRCASIAESGSVIDVFSTLDFLPHPAAAGLEEDRMPSCILYSGLVRQKKRRTPGARLCIER